MIRPSWILLIISIFMASSLLYCLNRMSYYRANYNILKKQQQYYVKQSQYLVKRNELMMKSIDLEQHKMNEVRYENIGIHDKRITPKYFEWLCTIATCKQQSSSSS